MKKNILIFIAVALGACCFMTQPLFAQQEAALKFSHKLHVVEQEIECGDCHDAAAGSQTGRDDLLPVKATCLECHEEDEVGDAALLPRITDYNLKFSHQKHLAANLECQSCHSKVIEKTEVGSYILPDMAQCMDCHQSRSVSIDCRTCHLPEDQLLPPSHTPAFRHNHSDLARLAAAEVSANKDCALCHQQQFCQSCHEGDNLDRLTHPLNFQFTHSLEAQGRERECAVCHSEREFCINCHRDNLVLPHTHTAGWVNQIPNDGGRHRMEAINDLEACMACHEQNAQEICQPCHGQ